MKIFRKIALAFITFVASMALMVVPANAKKVEAATLTHNVIRIYVSLSWNVTYHNINSIPVNFTSNATSDYANYNTGTANKVADITSQTQVTSLAHYFNEGNTKWRPNSSGSTDYWVTNSTIGGEFKPGYIYRIGSIEYTHGYSNAEYKWYKYVITQPGTFTILDANGGQVNGKESIALEVSSTGNLSLADYEPTRDGYAFRGWALSTDQSQLIDSVSGATPNTLIAQWEEAVNLVELKLDADEGYINNKSSVVIRDEEGTIVDLSAYVPNRLNYSFAGWFNENDEPVTSIELTEDVTLTAKWEEAVLTHDRTRVYLEVGNWNPAVTNVKIGMPDSTNPYQKTDIATKAPTGNDYASSNSSGNYYRDIYLTEDITKLEVKFDQTQNWLPDTDDNLVGGTFSPGYVYSISAGYQRGSGNTKYFSSTVNTVAAFVIFNANGGTINDKLSVAVETPLNDVLSLSSYTPSRTGFVFSGWYEEGNSVVTSITVNGPKTLKAKWIDEANYKTITFKNGNEVVNKFDGEVGDAIPVPPAPTAEPGYKFVGWFNGEEQLTSSTLIADNVTYTAKWEFTGVVEMTTTRVYFYNRNSNGEKVFENVYAFSTNTGAWPGVPAHQLYNDSDYYYFDIPLPKNDTGTLIIFSDGLTQGTRYQTEDLYVTDNALGRVVTVTGDSTDEDGDACWKYPVEFIGADNLNLNAQFQTSVIDSNTMNLRILSSLGTSSENPIDLGSIEKIGFVVSTPGGQVMKEEKTSCTYVFQNVEINGVPHEASALGGEYFFAIVFNGVPIGQQLIVTPYAVVDGQFIFGATEHFVVGSV